MPKIEIKFEGIEKLEKALKENVTLADVKKVVKHHGAKLQQKAQDNADFRGHWAWKKGSGRVFQKPTGALKESIGLEFENGGLTAVVEPGMEYAAYVELGTRFMDAQPYLKPAWEQQQTEFKRDLEKLMR